MSNTLDVTTVCTLACADPMVCIPQLSTVSRLFKRTQPVQSNTWDVCEYPSRHSAHATHLESPYITRCTAIRVFMHGCVCIGSRIIYASMSMLCMQACAHACACVCVWVCLQPRGPDGLSLAPINITWATNNTPVHPVPTIHTHHPDNNAPSTARPVTLTQRWQRAVAWALQAVSRTVCGWVGGACQGSQAYSQSHSQQVPGKAVSSAGVKDDLERYVRIFTGCACCAAHVCQGSTQGRHQSRASRLSLSC